MVMTDDIGVRGNLFGGRFLSWVDIAAGIFAAQKIKCPNIVTLKIEEFLFHRPSKLNDLIKIYGSVVKIGGSSITVHIEAKRHEVTTGLEELIGSTNIVMVRIDEDGNPVKIDAAVELGK